jgi:hypothetical protein
MSFAALYRWVLPVSVGGSNHCLFLFFLAVRLAALRRQRDLQWSWMFKQLRAWGLLPSQAILDYSLSILGVDLSKLLLSESLFIRIAWSLKPWSI